MKRTVVFLVFSFIGLVPLVLFFSMGGGKIDPTSKVYLQETGYTQIQILGHSWVGCNSSTLSGANFKAISPITHRIVYGEVCTTWNGFHDVVIK